jgi:hypothetical protein
VHETLDGGYLSLSNYIISTHVHETLDGGYLSLSNYIISTHVHETLDGGYLVLSVLVILIIKFYCCSSSFSITDFVGELFCD